MSYHSKFPLDLTQEPTPELVYELAQALDYNLHCSAFSTLSEMDGLILYAMQLVRWYRMIIKMVFAGEPLFSTNASDCEKFNSFVDLIVENERTEQKLSELDVKTINAIKATKLAYPKLKV